MSITSKSPRKVTLVVLRVAKEALPTCAHPNAPKIYTQHQLFASLVLKRFFKTDYRSLWHLLRECADLRRWLGFTQARTHNAVHEPTAMNSEGPANHPLTHLSLAILILH